MTQSAVLAAAFLGTFVFGVFSAFWGMMVPEIEKKVGKAATILLANSIGLVIGSILSGPVIDQYGNKYALAIGIGLVTIGVFFLGRVGTKGAAFMMALLVGIGGSAIVTAANTVAQLVTQNMAEGGLWSNIVNNFFAVGAFITPIILARLIARGRSLQQIGTVLGVICLAIFVYYLAISFPPPAVTGGSLVSGAGAVTGKALFWILAVMLLLYVGCEGTVWYWLNKYLTQELKIDPKAAGNTVALFAIGIIIGRVIASYLLGKDILSPLVLTMCGAVGIFVTYTGLLFVRGLGTIRVFAILAGLSMAPMFPTVLAAAGKNFPANAGTAIGLAITAGWLGYVFIPPSIGYSASLRRGMFITSGAAALLVVANVVALAMR